MTMIEFFLDAHTAIKTRQIFSSVPMGGTCLLLSRPSEAEESSFGTREFSHRRGDAKSKFSAPFVFPGRRSPAQPAENGGRNGCYVAGGLGF